MIDPRKKQGYNKGWDNLRPQKRGEPPPPGVGRPKKENTFSDIAREMLKSKKIDIQYTFPKNGKMITSSMHMEADKTMNHSLAAVLIKEGMSGNVKAIQEIIDRVEGKPSQKLDITSKDKSISRSPLIDLSMLSENQVDNLRSTIRDLFRNSSTDHDKDESRT